MSLPNRDNPYSFDEFLQWRSDFDFLMHDEFLKKAIRFYAPELSDEMWQDLSGFSERLSRDWQHWADESGKPENAPYMQHFDGHNQRIDRIVRPASTLALEKAVWQEAVFSEAVHPWVRFLKIFMLCQLGENGTNCAHCCTGGLIMILEQFAESDETLRILQHLKEGINGDYGIGAQFLSEIQGGSDVAANLVEAVQTDDGWRVYGNKFFCSAAHADYAVITAKPKDSHHVGVFVVPSWLPGDKGKERRNHYVINKLKSKLGTRELPTAEINFEGALAYPLGDLKRGLANIVGIVLSHSRFVTGLSAGAQLLRVAREAKAYSETRTAFGVAIKDFGLVQLQIQRIEQLAQQSTAAAFKLQREIYRLEHQVPAGVDPEDLKRRQFHVRILIMLQKFVACSDSVVAHEEAMSVFGGHGLMEDFSALPRLYRDAVVLNGAWEGPRNLLLTRIFMDVQSSLAWYEPRALVQALTDSDSEEKIDTLTAQLVALTDHDSLTGTDQATLRVCEQWDQFCVDLFHCYQEVALAEIK